MGHLLIKCKNCQKFGYLQTTVKLSKINEHLSKCEYSSYQCLSCDKKISNSKHDCIEHSYKCGFSNVPCSYCRRTIKLYQKNSHEEKCANEKIECDKCTIKIERKNLENRKKNDCQFREVVCNECHEKYIFNQGHTKENCYKIRYENLLTFVSEKYDKLDITKEQAEFYKIKIPMRRQNSEANLNSPQKNFDTLSFNSEKKYGSSKYNYIFNISSIIKNDEDMDYILGLFKKNIKKFILIYKMNDQGRRK